MAVDTNDVLVVGGGVNGASLAFHLAQRGVGVTLVEKGFIAGGPTGRSCGIIRQHYSHPATARMALDGLRVFENFADAVGGDCGFHRTGALVTAGEDDLATLEANVALQQEVGINTRILHNEELTELEPGIDLEGIVAAAWEPDAGYADAHLTTTAYARRAAELGARIHVQTLVHALLVDGGRVRGVDTDGGRFAAGAVVLAAGPWARALVRPHGIDLPSAGHRVQVGLFEPVPEVEPRTILLDAALGFYTRPESGPLMVVGSLRTADAAGPVDNPDACNDSVDFERIARYSESLARRYPAMARGAYRSGYASLYDVSPDWQPILDSLPEVDNLFVVAGSSGHGFKLAPAVGRMMATRIVDGRQPGDDLDLFAFDRFATDRRADGGYAHKILG